MISVLVREASSLDKERPTQALSHEELLPFFGDLRSWLQVSYHAVWSKLLEIDAGQPFRLNLWHALSLISTQVCLWGLVHQFLPVGSFFRLMLQAQPTYHFNTVTLPGSQILITLTLSMN